MTTPLGILLLAERAAILSGRDDEFVAVVLDGYTGMRWGEIVGLETQYVRAKRIRVEWQLYELDTGELYRCPPKDDSYRDIDLPDFLDAMLANHITRTRAAALQMPRLHLCLPRSWCRQWSCKPPRRQAG